MSRRPDPDRIDAARRAAILAAAQACFWRSGIRRTAIEDVAVEAKLAKGTIYLYFASKEELFAALAARGLAVTRHDRALLVTVDPDREEDTGDLIVATVADLELPLHRLDRQRRRLSELFTAEPKEAIVGV